MFIRDFVNSEAIIAGDNTLLRELFNPLKDDLDLRYSLAVAVVERGGTTFLHKLKHSEVYFILDGTGLMRVGDEIEPIKAGHAIYIPPNALQQIKNTGAEELLFVSIVDPAWKEEDEEILKEDGLLGNDVSPATELEFATDDVFDDDDIFDDEEEAEVEESKDDEIPKDKE